MFSLYSKSEIFEKSPITEFHNNQIIYFKKFRFKKKPKLLIQ